MERLTTWPSDLYRGMGSILVAVFADNSLHIPRFNLVLFNPLEFLGIDTTHVAEILCSRKKRLFIFNFLTAH